MEAEGNAAEHADLGVGRFHEGLGEVVAQGAFDALAVGADLLREFPEGIDSRALGPGYPAAEQMKRRVRASAT